jgi:uncharacterized protein YecE (DUF72 family)
MLSAPRLLCFNAHPAFAATEENVSQLKRFFHWASRGQLRFAWEPRHPTWTPELVGELCREHDLIHAVDPFEQESVFGEPRYYRLHGTATGNFRYEYDHPYSEEELDKLKSLCTGSATYCMFNNKQMATDAERFQNLTQPVDSPIGIG